MKYVPNSPKVQTDQIELTQDNFSHVFKPYMQEICIKISSLVSHKYKLLAKHQPESL